jgi:hypothetical protein
VLDLFLFKTILYPVQDGEKMLIIIIFNKKQLNKEKQV